MRVLSKQPLTPGCGLLPSPSATGREGRLSMKAHTQASTIPLRAHFIMLCWACLLPGHISEGSLHHFCWQELYNRASQPCPRNKNTKKARYLRVLSLWRLTYISSKNKGFNWFPDASLVGTHLALNQSSKEVHSFHTEGLLHRGSRGLVDGLDSTAKLPGFKSSLCHLLVTESQFSCEEKCRWR